MTAAPVALVNDAPDRQLSRLRWRARRGLLENDLVLSNYLENTPAVTLLAEMVAFDQLLDLSDNALWDILIERMDPPTEIAALVHKLRRIALSSSP